MRFPAQPAAPDRPDCVNNVFGFQPISSCNFSVPDITAAEMLAGRKQALPCRIVNSPVNPTTAEKRGVRGIDHAVNVEFGDVSKRRS